MKKNTTNFGRWVKYLSSMLILMFWDKNLEWGKSTGTWGGTMPEEELNLQPKK